MSENESAHEHEREEDAQPLTQLLPDGERDELEDATYQLTAPWQARAFGLVVVSVRRDERFDWSEFQSHLIDAIDAVEDVDLREGTQIEQHYYQQWLDAFETLLVDSNVLTPAEINARAEEFALENRTAEEFVEGNRHDH